MRTATLAPMKIVPGKRRNEIWLSNAELQALGDILLAAGREIPDELTPKQVQLLNAILLRIGEVLG